MAEHVIIIGFDGLRPDAINAEDCPHLYRLLGESAVSANHRAVYPTETRVNLTAISTGGIASEHGIIANELMSRSVGGGQLISTGSISDLVALNADAGGRLLGLPTASEFLHAKGRSMAVLSSGAEGSWRLLSWDAERYGHFAFNPHAHHYTAPYSDFEEIRRKFNLANDNLPELMTDIFLRHVWDQFNPALSIIWFTETDKASHLFGPASIGLRKALRNADEQLARLVAWRDGEPNRSNIAIIVMSDHGHMSIAGKVSVVKTLRDAGFKASYRLSLDADIGVVPGSSTNIWFRNDDIGYAQAVYDALSEQAWFGCGLSSSSSNENNGRIRGTFSLQTVGAQHSLSPDLVILFKGDAARNQHGAIGTAYADIGNRTYPVGAGYHGGLHPMELRCLFALNSERISPGIRDGYTCTPDVLPTAYALLGMQPQAVFSGRPFGRFATLQDQPERRVQEISIRGLPRYLEWVEVEGRQILEGMTSGDRPSELYPVTNDASLVVV